MNVMQREPKFGIGAVARITGIAPDTLRIWERRYSVVEPDRGEGLRRLYGRGDITRLTLIKQLVDKGNAISSVARLSEAELREKLEVHHSAHQGGAGERSVPALEVMVYGDALPLLWPSPEQQRDGLMLLGAFANLVDLEREAAARNPDQLILEFPSVQRSTVDHIHDILRCTGVERCVVVYGFGAKDAIRRLASDRVRILRAPVELHDIARACFSAQPPSSVAVARLMVSDPGVEAPPRKFDNRSLATIASSPSAVECECPHHLVDLIHKLNAFEVFSSECEDRDDHDAALHAYMCKMTAQARFLMETALDKLVEMEKIKL